MTPENSVLQLSNTANPAVGLPATDNSSAKEILRSKYGSARLLVVEDNPVHRGAVMQLILAAGLAADTAQNGRQAVEKHAKIRYDLILMDVLMPLMNGLEATHAIRRQPGGVAAQILAMTANSFAEARPACIAAGMQDLVAKPINPIDFYSTLLKWLSAANAHSESGAATPTPDFSRQDGLLPLLAGIPDLDPECGLVTMQGNVTKYVTVLQLFADECRLYAEKLSAIHAGDNLPAILLLTASLQGNAVMLGARKIAEAAGEAVSACQLDRGIDPARPLFNVLIDELLRFAEQFQKSIPWSDSIANPAKGRPRHAEDVLSKLESLLERGSIKANHLARDNAELIAAAFGKSGRRLLARIEAFDYENAVGELHELRAGLDVKAS